VSVFTTGATLQSIPAPSYWHQSPLFSVPPDCNSVASVIWVFNSDIVSTSSSVITSTQLPSPSKNSLGPHSVVALESKVTNPASFVKSDKVTAVVFNSESPIASALISTASIVLSTISLDSMSVPRVELIVLPAMLMPAPSKYTVPLS